MKFKVEIQSVKRVIAAAAVSMTLLAGLLGMLPSAKQAEVDVARVEHVEEVAFEKPNTRYHSRGNFWSG